MKNGLRLTLIVLGLAAVPAIGFGAAGWTSYGSVEEVYPNAAGTYYVRLTLTSNPSSCTSTQWFYNSGSGTGASRVFAALLTAHATGKPLRLYVTGACDANGYSELSSASLSQ